MRALQVYYLVEDVVMQFEFKFSLRLQNQNPLFNIFQTFFFYQSSDKLHYFEKISFEKDLCFQYHANSVCWKILARSRISLR